MLPLKDNVPTRTTPVVTIGLIVANALVWIWEIGGRGVNYHVAADGYYPCTVEGPCADPDGFLRTAPHRNGLDGFFAARLRART